MHSAYALGWCESEVRDQEVEINAEIPGGGYSAAGHGVAKSFDIPLQSIHKPILPFRGRMATRGEFPEESRHAGGGTEPGLSPIAGGLPEFGSGTNRGHWSRLPFMLALLVRFIMTLPAM